MQPALVSEPLSWSCVDGLYANDLLPLPFTREALAHVVARVQQVQEALGRPLLLENLSSHVSEDVWALYAQVLRHLGPRPTLIEWDAELPPLPSLVAEAHQAAALMEEHAHACCPA